MHSPDLKLSITPPPHFGRAIGVAMICAVLIGCTPPPDLQERVVAIDSSTPWPKLFTNAQLIQGIAPTNPDISASTSAVESLAARAAALRVRARGLSAPVLDNASRKRLLAAVARHP